MKKNKPTKAWIRMPLQTLQKNGMKKSTAFVLGIVIDECTDMKSGRAEITQEYICNATNYSARTVRDALKELEAMKLISVKRNGRASEYRLTGAVTILPPKKRGSESDKEKALREQEKLRQQLEMEAYLSLTNRFDDDPVEIDQAHIQANVR